MSLLNSRESMMLGNVKLKYATAQPLMQIDEGRRPTAHHLSHSATHCRRTHPATAKRQHVQIHSISVEGLQDANSYSAGIKPVCSVEKVTPRRMAVALNDTVNAPQVAEYFMRIDYTADVAMAFLNGRMVQDEFWHAQPWMIGLNRHKAELAKEPMSFYFHPLRSDATCLQDLPAAAVPSFDQSNSVLDIHSVQIVPQYQVKH